MMRASKGRPSILDIRCSLSLCDIALRRQLLRHQKHYLHCFNNSRFNCLSTPSPNRSTYPAPTTVASAQHARNSLRPMSPLHRRKISTNSNSKPKKLEFKEKAEERKRRRVAKEAEDYDESQWTARARQRSPTVPLHMQRRFRQVEALETNFDSDLELQLALQQLKPVWMRKSVQRQRSEFGTPPEPVFPQDSPDSRKEREAIEANDRFPTRWSRPIQQEGVRRPFMPDSELPSFYQPSQEMTRRIPTQTDRETHPFSSREILGEGKSEGQTEKPNKAFPPHRHLSLEERPLEEHEVRIFRRQVEELQLQRTFKLRYHISAPSPRREQHVQTDAKPLASDVSREAPSILPLRISRETSSGRGSEMQRKKRRIPTVNTPEYEDLFWIRDVDEDVTEISKARRYYDFDPALLNETSRTSTKTSATLTTRGGPLREMRKEATLNESAPVSTITTEDTPPNKPDFPTQIPEIRANDQLKAIPVSTPLTEEVPQKEAKTSRNNDPSLKPNSPASMPIESEVSAPTKEGPEHQKHPNIRLATQAKPRQTLNSTHKKTLSSSESDENPIRAKTAEAPMEDEETRLLKEQQKVKKQLDRVKKKLRHTISMDSATREMQENADKASIEEAEAAVHAVETKEAQKSMNAKHPTMEEERREKLAPPRRKMKWWEKERLKKGKSAKSIARLEERRNKRARAKEKKLRNLKKYHRHIQKMMEEEPKLVPGQALARIYEKKAKTKLEKKARKKEADRLPSGGKSPAQKPETRSQRQASFEQEMWRKIWEAEKSREHERSERAPPISGEEFSMDPEKLVRRKQEEERTIETGEAEKAEPVRDPEAIGLAGHIDRFIGRVAADPTGAKVKLGHRKYKAEREHRWLGRGRRKTR